MGRKPTTNLNLPVRLRARRRGNGKTYYFYDTGDRPRREIALGTDYALAVKQWAELETSAKPCHVEIVTFRYVAERYRREVIPTKAQRTQRDNAKELEQLYKFFDNPPAPIEQIQPIHVRQYLDWRRDAPVRANREKSLISHIWNKAREWGYTDRPNPCHGVRGFKETGRDVYTEDDVLAAVRVVADGPLQDALDLAYLTGQRPADTLRHREGDLNDDGLFVRQGKTRKKLQITLRGEFKTVIQRILERKKSHKIRSLALICNERGQPLGKDALRYRFDKAREQAILTAQVAQDEAQTVQAKERLHQLIDAIRNFQFRDLRAKAGTDKAEATGDMRQAQKQLGHSSIVMTEHYIRRRKGDKVEPTR